MAAGTTLHRFEIALSDVDRGVYEALDLRVPRHPSETVPFLLTRTLAYCLEHEPGISFSPGLSSTEEPAISVRTPTGELSAWIEVGLRSPERLHKASKSAARVAVYSHRELEAWKRQCEAFGVHRAAGIRIRAVDPRFLDALGERLERRTRWELSVSEQVIYLGVDGLHISTELVDHRLGE
jgi:uncharacterized protein YaeQ